MTEDKIKEIKRQIVAKLEKGEDVSELSRQLAQERAKIASQAEVEELKKVADARQALKKQAEIIKATVERQATAIDAFLAYRDKILPQLQALIEPIRELARMGKASWDDKQGKPGECYIYNDQSTFQATMRDIPRELFSDGFKCPTLEMAIGTQRSFNKSIEAQYYFEACVSILSNFRKGFMTPFKKATDESLLLGDESEIDIETGKETETGKCLVCAHSEVETINKYLKEGKSLRDIEAEYGISRSTLSRHKNKCLNLGVIRVERESSTCSSNQTYFKG